MTRVSFVGGEGAGGKFPPYLSLAPPLEVGLAMHV